MSNEDTVKILYKLKRRVGKERAFFARVYNGKLERTGRADERSFGEISVCDTMMRLIDDEVKKLAK